MGFVDLNCKRFSNVAGLSFSRATVQRGWNIIPKSAEFVVTTIRWSILLQGSRLLVAAGLVIELNQTIQTSLMFVALVHRPHQYHQSLAIIGTQLQASFKASVLSWDCGLPSMSTETELHFFTFFTLAKVSLLRQLISEAAPTTPQLGFLSTLTASDRSGAYVFREAYRTASHVDRRPVATAPPLSFLSCFDPTQVVTESIFLFWYLRPQHHHRINMRGVAKVLVRCIDPCMKRSFVGDSRFR
jgi:hypothetical protein